MFVVIPEEVCTIASEDEEVAHSSEYRLQKDEVSGTIFCLKDGQTIV